MNPQDALLTVPEAAERLTVKVPTLRVWIAKRRIGFIRVGSLIRIPESAIQEFLQAGYRARVAAPPGSRLPLAKASTRLRLLAQART